MHLSKHCINSYVYCPYHSQNKNIVCKKNQSRKGGSRGYCFIKHKNSAIRRANVNLAVATETRRMGLNLFRQVAQGPRRQSAHKGRGVYRASMKKDSGIFVFRSYL